MLPGIASVSHSNFVGLTVTVKMSVYPSKDIPPIVATNLILNSGLVGFLVKVPLITPVVRLIANPVCSVKFLQLNITPLTYSPLSVLMCSERDEVGEISLFRFPVMSTGIISLSHSSFVGFLELLQLVVVNGRVVNNPPPPEKLMQLF